MRTWRFGIASLAIAVVVGAALAAHAPTPEAMSVSGRVVSAATGRPIAGAWVSMSVSDGILSAAADGSGAFRMVTSTPGR